MFIIVAKFLSFWLLFVAVKSENVVPDVKLQELNVPQIEPHIAARAQIPITPAVIETFQNCSGRWDSYCYDCRTLIVCAGDEEPIIQTTCPSTEPYCDFIGSSGMSQRCVVNMQDSITEQMCNSERNIALPRCTSVGFYPDANDARKYYFCQGLESPNPDVYTCPEDTMFDTIDYNCQRIIPFDCTGKVNEFVLHSQNPAYYAYCRVNGGQTDILPYKCRDDQNFAYNLKTNACEYQCKEEGHFVDREDCQNYYECYRSGQGLAYRRISCSMYGMFYFSKEKGACVPDMHPCYPEVGYF